MSSCCAPPAGSADAGLSTAEDLMERFVETGFGQPLPGQAARLVLCVLRRLAEGTAIPSQEVARLAAGTGAAASDLQLVHRRSDHNADGDVVGILGLSLTETPHGFHVGARHLFTWCAWDTLFLPALLGEAATVASPDPSSGTPITLTITPQGVAAQSHPETHVSIIVPEKCEPDEWDAQRTREEFCAEVHFFPTRAAGESWAAARGLAATFLTVHEAWRLGQLRFRELLDGLAEPIERTAL